MLLQAFPQLFSNCSYPPLKLRPGSQMGIDIHHVTKHSAKTTRSQKVSSTSSTLWSFGPCLPQTLTLFSFHTYDSETLWRGRMLRSFSLIFQRLHLRTEQPRLQCRGRTLLLIAFVLIPRLAYASCPYTMTFLAARWFEE